MNTKESLADRIHELEVAVQDIQFRNSRVEGDKAWETSLTRTGFISVITYICTSIVFYLIGVEDYLLNALIPTVGYFLSTQSLPILKSWWLGRR